MAKLYSLVDSRNLFIGTVSTDEIDNWIQQNTKRTIILNRIAHAPTPADYAISVGAKSIQIVNPPTPTPIVACWEWCDNTWKLNENTETFPLTLVQDLRRKAYKKETDGLKLDAEYNAIISNAVPDYTKWITAKDLIRNKYPIPPSMSNS